MKNKVIKIVVFVIFVVIIVFVYFYFSDAKFINKILPDNIVKKRELYIAQSYFPDTIGKYILFGESVNKVQINKRCNKIEENPILKATSRTGDACMETFSGEYREETSYASTTDVIRVNLSRFTQAGDLLTLLVKQSSDKEILDGLDVFRLAPFEIGWSPADKFDLILVQDGDIITSTSSVIQQYSGTATGANDVTKYFLSKYAPAKH